MTDNRGLGLSTWADGSRATDEVREFYTHDRKVCRTRPRSYLGSSEILPKTWVLSRRSRTETRSYRIPADQTSAMTFGPAGRVRRVHHQREGKDCSERLVPAVEKLASSAVPSSHRSCRPTYRNIATTLGEEQNFCSGRGRSHAERT
jgi:hypothetical protein